jgi:hypothetical protein
VKTQEKGNSRKKAQKAQKGWDRENNGARLRNAISHDKRRPATARQPQDYVGQEGTQRVQKIRTADKR